jgi:hypothetical protein
MQRANSLDLLGRMVEVEAEAPLPGGTAPFKPLLLFSVLAFSPLAFPRFFFFPSLAFPLLLFVNTIDVLREII